MDYDGHLARESARFAEVLAATRPDTPVPSCPGWSALDLWRHLALVQGFWGAVLERGALTDADVEAIERDRTDTSAADVEVPALFAAAGALLLAQLAARPDDQPAWTWADERTVGFIRRRQAHEALIHRVDAELTASSRTPLPEALAADGVDEVLRIMKTASEPWATTTPTGGPVRVHATDTGRTWLVTTARFVGVDPGSGTSYDEPCFEVAAHDDGRPAAAQISGRAADLDCWLWGRPPVEQVQREGADDVLELFEEVRGADVD